MSAWAFLIVSDEVVHLTFLSFQQIYLFFFILFTGLLLGWGGIERPRMSFRN